MKRFALLFAVLLVVLSGPAQAVDPALYGKLPGVQEMRLSPSGERYAFLGTIGAKRMLVVAGTDGKALYAADVGELKVRSVRWAGDDHILMLVTKTENLMTTFGNTFELATVLRISVNEKKMARIFDGVPSVAQRIFGMYGTATSGGKAFGYFGGITLEEATGQRAAYVMGSADVNLYRVDLDSGKADIESKGRRGRSSNWLIAPDGKIAATSVYEPKAGEWSLHPGDGYTAAILTRKAPLHQIGLAGLGRSPGTYLVVDQTGEFDQALEVRQDGKTEELFRDQSVSQFLFDSDTGLLIGAALNDAPNAMFFDPTMDARWQSLRKTFPGLNVTLQSAGHNLDRMIIKSDGGQDSGTFWLVEPATGKTTPLAKAYPEIVPSEVGLTQMITYNAEDGLEIHAVLTLPPGSTGKNLPLVVMPHGGPIGISDKVEFDWWAQAFAGNGYAVVQPNYRGSSGSSGAFRDAGYGEWGKKMLSDIKDGVTALVSRGVVDPKRVCIVGGSYGGYAAMAGITLQQGIYRCAVSVAGVSDVRRLFQGGNAEFIRYRRAVTGSDKLGDSVMDEISPIRFAKRADAPILLIHGEDDTVVPIAQSGAMAEALESAGKPVQFVRMKSEDHWLSRAETRTEMLKEAVAFVQKYNPAN